MTMTAPIAFWMKDQHIAAAKAAGAVPQADNVPLCPLVVGDTVSFPGFRPMAFRVVSRHYRHQADEGPCWLLELEPSEHPF